MKIKFTPATIAKLKHPTGKHPHKCFDLTCEGLACVVQPQPSRNRRL